MESGKNPLYWKFLFTGGSNPRRCIMQDDKPNTLPTELFRTLCLISSWHKENSDSMKSNRCNILIKKYMYHMMVKQNLHAMQANLQITLVSQTQVFLHGCQLIQHALHKIHASIKQFWCKFLIQPCLTKRNITYKL